jgi:hypothetical protein
VESVECEPLDRIMLLRSGIANLPGPLFDSPNRKVFPAAVKVHQRSSDRRGNSDVEFFAYLTHQRVEWRLAFLDVTAREIPHAGKQRLRRRAVTQEDLPIANEQRTDDVVNQLLRHELRLVIVRAGKLHVGPQNVGRSGQRETVGGTLGPTILLLHPIAPRNSELRSGS